jgi:hypothetical protein
VLFDPARRWATQAICDWDDDEKLYFADGGQPNRAPGEATQVRWGQAKEICAGCPVLKECRRDTLGEEYGVYGGYDEHERWLIRRALPKAAKGWPPERRLAWGRLFAEMRAGGATFRTISLQTGFSAPLATTLVEEWEEHLAARQAAREAVVELPVPVFERKRPGFPDRPGRRHAWVRHRGGVSDAYYRGQTPDGVWVYVQTWAGRGNVNKWVPATDVHLYYPQPVVIRRRREEQTRAREPDTAAPEPLIA